MLRSEPTAWDPGGNTGTGRSLGITIANAGLDENDVMHMDSRTELDSHANMAVRELDLAMGFPIFEW